MYGQIPTLEAELAEASALAAEEGTGDGPAGGGQKPAIPESAPMVKEEVGPDDVADVVSSWTGIPAGRLLEGEDRQAPADGGRDRQAARRAVQGGRRGV